MNRLSRLLALLGANWIAATVFLVGAAVHGATNFVPNAKRIVFLGDSITYSGEYVSLLDSYLLTRFPEREFEIIDVGLPSETVSGLSEPGHAGGAFPRPNLHDRLDRALEKLKPDLVFACYGMNDGIYYPFSDDRFAAFTNGIARLRQKVLASGARIIHLTPPTFDPVPIKARTLPSGLDEYRQPYEGYDEVLTRYSEWLLSQRSDGWQVIDVHGPMKRYLEVIRPYNSVLAPDGIHPKLVGHVLIAEQILAAWNLPLDGELVEIDWKTGGVKARRNNIRSLQNEVDGVKARAGELTFSWCPRIDVMRLAVPKDGVDAIRDVNSFDRARVLNAPEGFYAVFNEANLWGQFPASSLVLDPPLKRSQALFSIVHKRQKLLTDAWLTEIGHARPGMSKGVPIAQATEQAEVLRNEARQLARPELLQIRIVRE